MDLFFRFAYPWILYIGIPLLLLLIFLRTKFRLNPVYRYSMVGLLREHRYHASFGYKYFYDGLRFLIISLLLIVCARPQLVDVTSHVDIEGIDIMLVLDVSGSMEFFDDLQDRRSRIEVAKDEAIRFINKRDYDQIGLVLFGRHAISRSPLTLDKSMLKDMIENIQIGVINPDGTALSKSLVTAANRLKNSEAKTKIIILLTDGEPTPQVDIDPQTALDILKKFGIKVYTIGIAGEHGGLFQHPLFGLQSMGFRLNKELLEHIAQETGGEFFLAQNPQDMQRIYNTIDQLEKTEYQADIFTKHQDIFKPFLWIVFGLLIIEILFSTLVWFIL